MTIYRLAKTPADFKACHALMIEAGERIAIRRPTIVAERDGKIIAMLGTIKTKRGMVAGPLIISSAVHSRGFLLMRLIDNYDLVLRKLGLPSYFFHVRQANARWVDTLTRFRYEPFAQEDGVLWYLKKLA